MQSAPRAVAQDLWKERMRNEFFTTDKTKQYGRMVHNGRIRQVNHTEFI